MSDLDLIRQTLETYLEDTPLWPECCAACRDDEPFERDDHEEDCPHGIIVETIASLGRLVEAGNTLRAFATDAGHRGFCNHWNLPPHDQSCKCGLTAALVGWRKATGGKKQGWPGDDPGGKKP